MNDVPKTIRYNYAKLNVFYKKENNKSHSIGASLEEVTGKDVTDTSIDEIIDLWEKSDIENKDEFGFHIQILPDCKLKEYLGEYKKEKEKNEIRRIHLKDFLNHLRNNEVNFVDQYPLTFRSIHQMKEEKCSELLEDDLLTKDYFGFVKTFDESRLKNEFINDDVTFGINLENIKYEVDMSFRKRSKENPRKEIDNVMMIDIIIEENNKDQDQFIIQLYLKNQEDYQFTWRSWPMIEPERLGYEKLFNQINLDNVFEWPNYAYDYTDEEKKNNKKEMLIDLIEYILNIYFPSLSEEELLSKRFEYEIERAKSAYSSK